MRSDGAGAGAVARVALFAAGALVLAVAAAAWWFFPPDPVVELRRHFSPLARVVRVPAPELGPRVERWRLITAAGDTATALWRPAPAGAARPWTAVMLGGLRTGDRAALLLPPDAPVAALAVDWPWRESRTLTPWQVAMRLGAIRAALLRTPGVLALGTEAVARQPEVDSTRVVLLGASLGVPPALAALRLTRVPDALVLIDGAADLRALLAAGLERERWPAWLAAPAAAIAFRLLRPLEPALHGAVAARLPVLVINSERDALLPGAAIRRLHASLPRAETRWRRGGHLHPRRGDVIASLVQEVVPWLKARGDARARGPRSPRP